ncbi:MAG: recombinase family protein [Streptosporangiaceae bacterium]
MTTAAGIYVRISEDREGAGLGVERQERDCRELADCLGLDVYATYIDNDVSAYSGKPRPRYRDLLADIAAGRIQVVLAWHTDRLHRSPSELEEYIKATEGGVVTHTVKAGELNLSTPNGRLVARNLGSIARYESEHKGERVRSRYRQRVVDEFGFGGGVRRFGWARDGVTLIPAEAAEVRKAAKAIVDGASLRSITTDLNSRGILTATGKTWTHQRLREVLTRPRNIGTVIYDGEAVSKPGEAQWPAIMGVGEWHAVCAILNDPARRSGSANNRTGSLGSGLYVCGVCGERMRMGTSGTGGRVRAYRCPAHSHLSRAAGPLDEHVEMVVVQTLVLWQQQGKLDLAGNTGDRAELEAAKREIEGQLTGLANRFATATDDDDDDALLSQRRVLRAELARVKAEIAALPAERNHALAGIAGVPDIAAAWTGYDLSIRRGLLDAVCTVTVLPAQNRGGKFDPDAVRVEIR